MAHLSVAFNKGFSITFPNTLRLSVQFGPINYCEHYHAKGMAEPASMGFWKSSDAEIAVVTDSGRLIPFDDAEGDGDEQQRP